MKQVIIKAGEVVRVDQVMRGALLGYSEQEWMRRARVEQTAFERNYSLMGLSYLILAFGWATSWVLWSQERDLWDLLFALMWGCLGVAQLLGYFILARRNRNPVAVPGLYENGIQFPTHFFVPYPEIGKIERKPKRLNSFKKKDIIRLRSKFAKKPGSITDGWAVSAEFLGTGGMAALKERLEITRGLRTTGRPTLVLYGPGGARSQERGMEPIQGTW